LKMVGHSGNAESTRPSVVVVPEGVMEKDHNHAGDVAASKVRKVRNTSKEV